MSSAAHAGAWDGTSRPLAAVLRGGLRVAAQCMAVYRRTWRGSLIVSFVSPLLFLAAMGVGLGGLVRSGGVGGVSYVRFLAPGLLAATAMQTASLEMSYRVMAKVRWQRLYDALLATPLTVPSLVAGEAAWLAVRLGMAAASYLVVMALFGVPTSVAVLLVLPAAVLCGLAFGLPIMAFAVSLRSDQGFAALNRFVVIPLFLLSGPFFPIGQLPRPLQGIAWTAPLSHGVALCRGIVLGTLDAPSALLHTGVLFAYAAAGAILAVAALRRRLLQ